MQLAEILQAYKALPEDQRTQVAQDAMAATKHMRFVPLPGRQTDAYLSLADVTLFGGKAGVGKSGLIVGLAQEHESSIIFRREASQTDGLEKFGKEVYGSEGFNGSDLEWTWPGGRSLKLAGLKEAPVHLAIFSDDATHTGSGLGQQTMPETLHYSVVAAVQTLWLAARADGIGMGWVSILDPVAVTRVLDVPSGWSLVAYLCLGVPAEEHLDPELERHHWESRTNAQAVTFTR